nr:MAG TPA: Putative tail protein [Caudoviricetes sp.]
MGYKVLYDNQLLFDPYTDDRITDTKLSGKLNAVAYFDFTIATKHSMHSKLAERAGEVRIYFDNLILFKGEITQIEEDFEGNKSVSCTGALDYLTATRVRPYSTVEGEQPLKAPSNFDGYFQWLIDQHNSNCLDSRKHFSVGVNQGNMLDKNNYIYRASEQRPTTASEIEDKILNPAGGYLFLRYQDDLNILDLYSDVHDVNTQIIDYGVNMLDFTKTTTAEGQYTAVVATGYTPDPPAGKTDVKMKPITLEGCTDGGTPYSSTIVKMGDRVYDVDAVNRYGYHEYYVSNTDITTYDGLLYYACKTLNTLLSPALAISVKAVDLALLMGDKYKHLQLGQAVRIRSKPRKVDEYLMVNSIDLDLMNPENTTFDLGASYDTLTGQQSAYLKSLNSSINASLDTVASLGDNVKNSAKLAQEAKDTAKSATDAANKASNKADSATSVANSASSKADQATETANSASSKADTANSNATKANAIANSANKTANAANDTANKANAKADTANKTANAASSKADTANDTANKADTKADQAITSAGVANNTANSASSKADDAVKKAEQTQENIKVVQKSVDAANEAASNAQTSADAASTAASVAQSTADTAKANASKAQTAADAAQSSANAANSAASKAQKSADAANSAIANTNKEVGTINSTITQIKKDAADTRDELSGQIETVKNTMTADYAKKTELSETEGTLRSEIETSAAGIKSEVSQKYTTKTELSKTNENVSKAQDTANKAAAAAASNASDLTEAIKTIGKTTDDLQSQIDGSIQTWFEDGEPTNLNYPAIDWTTDTIKKNHLGDLYYDNTTGYGYRWQIDQNGSYSWKRIVDTDVTKALQDAAKAQGTANSKRRIFVTTPVPPYDVADLWVQGTTGDIMRCQTAKGEGQTYAAADWIKASKYTDDTAVTKLAETVSVTYATKTTVNQLSDRIEQTVESVETVSASASAAQAAADKANAAAKAAQSTADTAKANAATAQTSADTANTAAAAAQKAADNAKSAADTAQSAADTANADLVTAKKNLEAVQNQADATDEQVAAAKAAVAKAQGAADKANAAAATAKSAADNAQSTANTAKANAATAQSKANAAASAASTAQSTADTAKANAKKAQDDVDAVKSRVTAAETKITQNSNAIALRATKTEVTNAVNGISVGGRNIARNTSNEWSDWITPRPNSTNVTASSGSTIYFPLEINVGDEYYIQCEIEFDNVTPSDGKRSFFALQGSVDEKWEAHKFNPWNAHIYDVKNGVTRFSKKVTSNVKPIPTEVYAACGFRVDDWATGRYRWRRIKVEVGNKSTDWSPAPEDLVSESKTYTDAQLKVTSDSITSTVSKTYATKTDLSTTNSNVTKAKSTADSAVTKANNAQTSADNAQTTANLKGIDYSQGKMLFTDPTFASGMNSCVRYSYANNDNVTVTRTGKSVDNPIKNATNELQIKTIGTAAPGLGGFLQPPQTRANAVFIGRVIAKIPVGYTLNIGMNATGDNRTFNWLTSQNGTGKFTEYVVKLVCGATGTFSTSFHYYLKGATATAANPVIWYVAYATAFDMTDVGDALTANRNVETLKTNVETNYVTKSLLTQTAEGITSEVSKTYSTKTDLSTTNSNVTKAQQKADAASTAASNAQTSANNAKKAADAVSDTLIKSYSTTEQTKSLINQSAESIKSEVSKTYQVKGDYATNSSVRSAIEQSANSITSTVESTYATKATVDALKNIADNAIESWSGTGIPTLTNKPASDWTTDDLKKQHLGDLYYDKATSYGYRFNQNGSGYSWDLIRDTGITQALADAAAANDAAKKAQSTANSGVSKANAAQSTANSASTAASNAQKTADTAKANAATAQADVNKLKTDIPNTYATKSSLTQTAESITAKVETAQSTADGAVTAASQAQQTADSISTTLSKNYTTTADADKKYATQSSLTQTAKSLTSKISSVETATTKAQADATSAIGKADQAHSDVGSLKTRMSTAETSIKQNSDAIALRATKTEVTNAIDNISIGGRNLLLGSTFNGLQQVDNTYQKFKNNSVKLVCDNTAGTSYKYVSIPSLKESWVLSDVVGRTLTISMWIYIEKVGQCKGYKFRIVYTDNGSTHWFDPDRTYPLHIPIAKELEQGWNYVYGSFTIPITATKVYFNFTCFASSGEISIAWFSSPKAEFGNKTTAWTPAPDDTLNEAKAYSDAQLKISSDSITSTVSSVKTIAETAKSTADTAKANAATATTTANTAKSTADTAKKAAESASSTASTAASNASSALSKASTAETNASSAKTTAEAANKTANTAKSTADAASTNASSALTKAGTAETTASSAKSTAEAANKTASTASSNASSALTKANSAASDASTAKSDAASAKSTANTAKSTADTARNELSNLKIGGENLVSNIASNWTAGSWNIPNVGSPTAIIQQAGRISLTSYVSIEPNTDYWIKLYLTKAGIHVLFRVLDSDKNYLSSVTELDNQKWTSPAKAYYLAVTLDGSVAVTLDDIQNGAVKIKLEKGNRSTDYSPSSADLSQIASTEAGAARATADSLAEKVTKEYVTRTQFEQTATSLTSRIQTTETTVSGMSSTVKNVNDYMTFAREDNKPTLTIGSSSSSFRTKLTNTGEKFMQGDQTIMELDGVTSTVKASRVQMGHYQWRDTGTSMQLVYIP